MTLRNIINEFKKLSKLNNYTNNNKTNNIDTNNNETNNIDTNNYYFQIKISKIKIEKQIEKLIKLQNKRFMVNFTSDDNVLDLDLEIENYVKEIINNIKIIQNNIIKVSKINNIDYVLKKNFIDTQSISLQELISKLRKCQLIYLQKINDNSNIIHTEELSQLCKEVSLLVNK